MKQMKKVASTEAKKAVKIHEKTMHKMASGGVVTRGNGCATSGTKARGPLA